jgi:hypoxanthine phosphoribosyltransferase
MKIIISRHEINQRVQELAEQISTDHRQNNTNSLPPVLVCVLNGSFHFFSDLTRMMSIDCEVDFIRLKSYEGQDNSGGITIVKDLELDLKGKRVYIVDDICDSGATMLEALFMVNSRMATEVKVVTLLKRKNGVGMTDFHGFEIGDEWVLGYGLDDYGLKRNLQDIYKIN